MILGAKRDLRAEGAGREGCTGVCWSTSRVPSGRKLLLHGPDDFCPFSPTTRHSIPTYMEFRSGVCVRVCGGGACSAVSESATPWTVAHQAPLSMEFSRQEHWSKLPFPPSGDLPDPGIKPTSPVSSALADRFFTTEPPLFR